ncbi:MAG: UDP-N-acetylmuramate--L-alanine ligase [Verrucomicrobiae bacterium]|nr:UDP-N-acetylmuramate--L-alanine ligase [Verrucomicrobiae bacterium]
MNGPVIEIMGRAGARVHLIGVAGSGMSGLARLMLQAGMQVSGSDLNRSQEIGRLEEQGLKFFNTHSSTHVGGCDLVVHSSAIQESNPEREAARVSGVPVAKRAEALAAIMARKTGILIGGMHGKTTTSSMMAIVLQRAGLKSGHYVGAEVPDLGASATFGEGPHFVAEADESDGTITLFEPDYSVILNIEEEHMDFYRDIYAIMEAFEILASHTRRKIFFCADDRNSLLLFANRPGAVSFGFSEFAQVRAVDVRTEAFGSVFKVARGQTVSGPYRLNIPGLQNVSNSLAVFAVGLELGLEADVIAAGLEEFQGARRRFEVCYKSGDYLVVDDYAHHPTEIRATLAAARSGHWRRILALFQPHRYSRTKFLKDEFAGAFEHADHVFLTDIYAASEKPLEGVSARIIAEEMIRTGKENVHYEARLGGLFAKVAAMVQPGDLVITLGAGNIHKVASRLAGELKTYEQLRGEVSAETEILRREPMRKHTTMHVGGAAQFWVVPGDESDLGKILRFARQNSLPWIVVGRGSNLLVRESGISGLVLHLGSAFFRRVEILEGHRIRVGAGARNKEVVMQLKRLNLGGFEYLAGIPGNIGGALRMNAGAMGGQTFDVVESVRFMNPDGDIFEKNAADLEVYYRHVPSLEKNIALSAVLHAREDDPEQIRLRLKAMDDKRWTSQPAAPSAGCIFKNPGPIGAGQLIDELGLKNTRVGGVRVSDIHGNFIINDQKGTADDVLALIEVVKARARQQRGIELETEVIILGNPGEEFE